MGLPGQVSLVGEQLEIDGTQLSSLQKEILLGSLRLGAESVGTPLDALQFLANTLLNLHQPESAQRSYTLELDGYRQKRQDELKEMALAAVEKVRATGQEYEFQALSAAERRQVHMVLSDPDYADLETFSRGKEPDRRLVIQLAHQLNES
jgi:spoIIIJ-associated protein